MIADLKPYPEYKESGQEWLGSIPSHWLLKPGSAAYTIQNIPNVGLKEKTVLSLSYGHIKIKPIEKQHGLVPKSYETYQIVNVGNIIIRGTDLQNDHSSLRIGVAHNRGIITSAYICLETRETVTPEFGYQILNVFDLTKAIYRYGSGLRQNLDSGEIKRLPIFLPPIVEQAAIVQFLDWANRRLEQSIQAKNMVISLLRDQKQAIIHRAVTRGLDPGVPIKSSGIPLLGEIPQHWEVWPLRRCISICSGDSVDRLPFHTDMSERNCIPVVGGNGIMGYTNCQNSNGTTIVIGRVGALCGNVHLIKCNSWVTDNALRIIRITGFDDSYLAEQLRVMNLNQFANANAQPLITGSMIKSQKVVKPPLDEQIEIIDRLECLVAPVTSTITLLEREIELLKEYHTRLVADIVTGKLDVRKVSMRLPIETIEQTDPNLDTEKLAEAPKLDEEV